MYTELLWFHSNFRWIALFALIYSFIVILVNKLKATIYSKSHFRTLVVICFILNIQLVLGILLFSESPIVSAFWQEVETTIKLRQTRFFGLEHPFMMVLGISLYNYFIYKSKKTINTTEGYQYLFKRLLFVLLILLTSIPWSFSPLTSRPNYRIF